jgi:hypothetical protein
LQIGDPVISLNFTMDFKAAAGSPEDTVACSVTFKNKIDCTDGNTLRDIRAAEHPGGFLL